MILQSWFCLDQRKICKRKEKKKTELGEAGSKFLNVMGFIF